MWSHISSRCVLLSRPTLSEVLLLLQAPSRLVIVNTQLVEVSQQMTPCLSVFQLAILSVYQREFLDLFRPTVSHRFGGSSFLFTCLSGDYGLGSQENQ